MKAGVQDGDEIKITVHSVQKDPLDQGSVNYDHSLFLYSLQAKNVYFTF